MRTMFRQIVLGLMIVVHLAIVPPVIHAQDVEQPVDLRPNFVVGRAARYQAWTVHTVTMTNKSQGEETSFSVVVEWNSELTWTVDSVRPDGSATCTIATDWATAVMTNPAGEVLSNDSRKSTGDTPWLHKYLRALVNSPVQVDVSADGTIVRVRGVDAIKRQLDNPDVITEMHFMENAGELAVVIAAPHAARLGTHWTHDVTWKRDLGTIRGKMNYRLDNLELIEDIGVATVNASTKFQFTPDPNRDAGDAKISLVQTQGEYESQIMFDLQRHEVVGRNCVEQRTVEMRIQMGDMRHTRVMQDHIQNQLLRIDEQ